MEEVIDVKTFASPPLGDDVAKKSIPSQKNYNGRNKRYILLNIFTATNKSTPK
jgi:hypothetical protein